MGKFLKLGVSIGDPNGILFLQLSSGLTLFSFILSEPLFKYSKTIKKISLLISQQTYSIYLFHLIIIYIVNKSDLSVYLMTPIYIILLFLISTLIYNLFEKPLLKLRPNITYKKCSNYLKNKRLWCQLNYNIFNNGMIFI